MRQGRGGAAPGSYQLRAALLCCVHASSTGWGCGRGLWLRTAVHSANAPKAPLPLSFTQPAPPAALRFRAPAGEARRAREKIAAYKHLSEPQKAKLLAALEAKERAGGGGREPGPQELRTEVCGMRGMVGEGPAAACRCVAPRLPGPPAGAALQLQGGPAGRVAFWHLHSGEEAITIISVLVSGGGGSAHAHHRRQLTAALRQSQWNNGIHSDFCATPGGGRAHVHHRRPGGAARAARRR